MTGIRKRRFFIETMKVNWFFFQLDSLFSWYLDKYDIHLCNNAKSDRGSGCWDLYICILKTFLYFLYIIVWFIVVIVTVTSLIFACNLPPSPIYGKVNFPYIWLYGQSTFCSFRFLCHHEQKHIKLE